MTINTTIVLLTALLVMVPAVWALLVQLSKEKDRHIVEINILQRQVRELGQLFIKYLDVNQVGTVNIHVCRYCGGIYEGDNWNCPYCGAPRIKKVDDKPL